MQILDIFALQSTRNVMQTNCQCFLSYEFFQVYLLTSSCSPFPLPDSSNLSLLTPVYLDVSVSLFTAAAESICCGKVYTDYDEFLSMISLVLVIALENEITCTKLRRFIPGPQTTDQRPGLKILHHLLWTDFLHF